jgi:CRISPR-associated endonuclease/helicase Cas3
VNGGGSSWHPLICHLLDVAASAEAMWDEVLPLAWKARLADMLGLDMAATRTWVVFLAGLHDLGKASPGFQLQLQERLALIQQRLTMAGFEPKPVVWIAHGDVSAQALKGILSKRFGFDGEVAIAAATAVGGHHGVFPSAQKLQDLRTNPSYGTSPRWENARLAYARWLGETLAVGATPPPKRLGHPAAIMLAGFASVVDWVGSSEFFTHEVSTPSGEMTRSLIAYLEHARAQAHLALKQQGWLGWKPPMTEATFGELFPFIAEPRALQLAAVDLAPTLNGPSIVVVEAPMGEGKTEAAEYLADMWNVRLGQQGVYFALPTQATSNQMFGRVSDCLSTRYPRNRVILQLAHGQAALVQERNEQTPDMLAPCEIEDEEDGRPVEGAVIAAEWFASGKRALLAPFGVGTVDQALLAALQVLHVFVRLYGLSTKTLIVDEVHAYDTYMSTLLERLMEWLGALGTPVILLSATLPNARREQLLEAYARGAGWLLPETPTSVDYPRITWASADGWGAQHIAATSKRARVTLEWLAKPGELDELGRLLSEELRDGGCAAVICNTVGRAQEVYQALKRRFSGNASDGKPSLMLFHARFLFEKRAMLEEQALARFGKDLTKRPEQAVIVATQVIEQSLDLDFDLMITDLAPVDLMLQRAGRLHRHAREGDAGVSVEASRGRGPRPPQLRSPRLIIAGPTGISHDNVPTFERGSALVYAPHILLRTWLQLRGREQVSIPDDVASLVEGVYEERACPVSASASLRDKWNETFITMEAARLADRDEAKNRYIKHPRAGISLAEVAPVPRKEDAPELHPAHQALTRLTELTAKIICLTGTCERPLFSDGRAAPMKTKPDRAMTKALLMRGVSVSSKRVVHQLLAIAVPDGWQKSPALRQCRPVVFDEAGTCAVGNNYILRLDEELGLVVERAANN